MRFFILFFCTLTLFAGESEPTLSTRAQQLLTQCTQATQRAEQVYLQAVQTAHTNLQRDMEREIGKLRLSAEDRVILERIMESEGEVKTALLQVATQNVQQAVLMREAIVKVQAETVAQDLLGNPVRPITSPAAQQAEILQSLLGSYLSSTGRSIILEADGKAQGFNNWSLTPLGELRLESPRESWLLTRIEESQPPQWRGLITSHIRQELVGATVSITQQVAP